MEPSSSKPAPVQLSLTLWRISLSSLKTTAKSCSPLTLILKTRKYRGSTNKSHSSISSAQTPSEKNTRELSSAIKPSKKTLKTIMISQERWNYNLEEVPKLFQDLGLCHLVWVLCLPE